MTRKITHRELYKTVRKSLTPEEKEQAKIKRKIYEKEFAIKNSYKTYDVVDRLFWAAKRRARVNDLEFNIEKQDIIVPKCCPYLGIELSFHSPRGSSRKHIASLYRINPNLLYIKGNVEVISHLANTMKNNASVSDLQSFAQEILKRHPV